MTRKPISIPISFFSLLTCSALAAPGYFEAPAKAQEKNGVSPGTSTCMAGNAYTCKIQCGPTTRTTFERFTNNAGVEACVNLGCTCEPQAVSVRINDPTQPTVFVIFGVRQLLPDAPQ